MINIAALEPLAWLHNDDPERVISNIQKSGSERDGGASASSVRPFSIPLGCLSLMEAYAAAKVRESQEWQPIETAPKDGTEIIGWNGRVVTSMAYLSDKDDNGHTGWCQSGYTDGGMLYYLHNALPDENQPTHWKPLPAPPIG